MLGDGLLIKDMVKGNRFMKNMNMKVNGCRIKRMVVERWYGKMGQYM